MRDFISAVALLVKVTASMRRYARGSSISWQMYRTAKVNVFPLPAEALYTKSCGCAAVIVYVYCCLS